MNLAGLVNHAIPKIDGGGSGVGITTLAGIQLHAEISRDMTLHITADPTVVEAADTQISPMGWPTKELQTVYLGVVDAVGYDHGWLGEVGVKALDSPIVCRTAGTVPDNRPETADDRVLMVAGNVPLLELTGVDLFQYATSFVWSTNGGIKRHYRRA